MWRACIADERSKDGGAAGLARLAGGSYLQQVLAPDKGDGHRSPLQEVQIGAADARRADVDADAAVDLVDVDDLDAGLGVTYRSH